MCSTTYQKQHTEYRVHIHLEDSSQRGAKPRSAWQQLALVRENYRS